MKKAKLTLPVILAQQVNIRAGMKTVSAKSEGGGLLGAALGT